VKDTFNRLKNTQTLDENMPVEDILMMLRNTKQRMFPVLNRKKALVGSFYIKDLPNLLQQSESGSKNVAGLMQRHILKVNLNDTIDIAQETMLRNNVDELVVVNELEKNNNVLGIITTADLMKAYNREMKRLKYGQEKPDSLPGDESLLKQMNLNKVLERGFLTVRPDETLGDLVNIFTEAKRNIFPVVGEDGRYHGIVSLNDIRKLLFDTEKYETVKISDIMVSTPDVVHIEDRMEKVMNKLEKTKTWNLPVIDDKMRYIGMVSQSTLFYYYRNQLLNQTET
jgi:CBS domain-containing protein